MIQTESPYFQYTTATESLGPFNSTLGLFNNDPIFPDLTCTVSMEEGDMWIKNLAVSKVHKLVFDEISPAVFEKLIKRCVQLEDLEYYIYSWKNYPDIVQAISPTKEKIRRLCFGYLPPPAPSYYERRLPDNDYSC